MRNNRIILVLLIAALVASCSKVPITGRKQLNLLPESMITNMGQLNYQQFKDSNIVLSAKDKRTHVMNSVGPRIATAVQAYMTGQGLKKNIEGYQWEFSMFDNSQVNAWAMPGGKIAIYTGILPYTKNDFGMATVIGHEIGHVIARHGNERMSQQLALALGGMSIQVAMQQEPEKTRDIFMMVYGVGSTLGTLAYSRQHEYEADKLGMVFMAMAGYDPSTSIEFWERMTASGGAAIPQFLSTHPSDQSRIQAMKDFLPQAMTYYKPQN
jgi:predicted Zn-dependent protease